MRRDPELLRVVSYAQDLPPGLPLLSRVENHIKEEFQRLASVTRLESAERQVP